MAEGLELGVGNLFNPSAQYSDQNNQQLQDGISKTQGEIDDLAKEQAGAVDEFSVENAGVRISQLRGDISAMQKQLASRTPGGQAEPPSLLEQAGTEAPTGRRQHAARHRCSNGPQTARGAARLVTSLALAATTRAFRRTRSLRRVPAARLPRSPEPSFRSPC